MSNGEPGAVLEAVKDGVDALEEVDEVWRSDHEVVLTAVQANGLALEFAASSAERGSRDCACSGAGEWTRLQVCLGGTQD
eukprot:2983060-Amphidinium_carterae.1